MVRSLLASDGIIVTIVTITILTISANYNYRANYFWRLWMCQTLSFMGSLGVLLPITLLLLIICIHNCKYCEAAYMATMNIRIDDDLKARSGAALEALGVTTSEAVRLVLEYVAQNNRLPVQVALLADEDADIIELARARLANPGKRIRVKLDDL